MDHGKGPLPSTKVSFQQLQDVQTIPDSFPSRRKLGAKGGNQIKVQRQDAVMGHPKVCNLGQAGLQEPIIEVNPGGPSQQSPVIKPNGPLFIAADWGIAPLGYVTESNL
jgi:hypothetical protein